MNQYKRIFALIVIMSSLAAVGARADEVTVCPMGGPTPGYRAIKFTMPEGSAFLGLEPHGGRATRPLSDDTNWHLASGVFIVNAATREIEAYRVESTGTAPRALVVSSDGTDVVRQATTTPDGPFYHTALKPRSGLRAGTYYAIGFGSDGGTRTPNEWWSYDVRVSGKHACTSIGSGTVFDVDNTEFTGGTQIYAGGIGSAEDITYSMTQPENIDVVVGLMDAAVQGSEVGGGEGGAELSYAMPASTGSVEDEIVPFSSTAGAHQFTGEFQGAFPMLLVAGVALDLP